MTAETYVNQIVKKVKCSRKKRSEIRRQLLADVMEAVEQGEPLEAVMIRMGEPLAIAEAFNEDLPNKERRLYKRSIAAKAAAIVFTVVAVLAFIFWWFVPQTAVIGSSGIYDAAQVEQQTKDIVRLLDEDDYEALMARSDPHLQSILTKEMIDDAKSQVTTPLDWGEFQEFGKCYMQEIRQQGKTQAIAQINVAYANTSVTYTVFFDEQMRLTGLYIK